MYTYPSDPDILTERPAQQVNNSLRMSRLLPVLILIAFACPTLNAQITPNMIQPPFQPPSMLDMRPGYITINEVTAGIGISLTNIPFSDRYAGFTTIHGYQIDRRFIVALGTGLTFYKAGTLIPVFMDFRYRFFNTYRLTSYFFADGGFLLNASSGFTYEKLLINPGAGIRYDINHSLAANLGIGIMVQQDNIRNSFLNIKLGFTFKPGKKSNISLD